ncbi:MAG TPA: hypothetical protein VIW92_12815 [Thermoanaerobaculia bacterium]
MKISFIALGTMLLFLYPVSAGAADVCANAKAAVTISDATWADGVLKASGTWQAGEGTTGVMMEYRIQSDRQWVELRAGASGTWEVTIPYRECGRNTFKAEAFPGVKDGAVHVQCLEKGLATTKNFIVDCSPVAAIASCQWECEEGPPARCTGRCTGTGRGGIGNLMGIMGVNDKGYEYAEGPPEGPWTATVTCSPGDKVTFLVRDQGGAGAPSKVVEHPCGQE